MIPELHINKTKFSRMRFLSGASHFAKYHVCVGVGWGCVVGAEEGMYFVKKMQIS